MQSCDISCFDKKKKQHGANQLSQLKKEEAYSNRYMQYYRIPYRYLHYIHGKLNKCKKISTAVANLSSSEVKLSKIKESIY